MQKMVEVRPIKTVYITEKPSQAMDYVKALHLKAERHDGYMESGDVIVTWCIGHLIALAEMEDYDPELKKWDIDRLPFFPETFKYKPIPNVKKQLNVVLKQLTRPDVDTIYFAGDSGREGQYIEELILLYCGDRLNGKRLLRIWIDSTTEEEIQRGIRAARPMSDYRSLGDAGRLRAIIDFLMGMNFSRAFTIKYGDLIADRLGVSSVKIAVGRVMSSVLAMIVRREQEIRNFVETPFYRVHGSLQAGERFIYPEWKAVEGTPYYQSKLLFKENGFKEKSDAEQFIKNLPDKGIIQKLEKKKELRYAPLLYNLAELQNECAKVLKISPDETLQIVQSLYENKLVTYPRTDARVLSTAVAKEIGRNISGLLSIPELRPFAEYAKQTCGSITKTRYVNDSKITDHYAIIPTGSTQNLSGLSGKPLNVYLMIAKRFLAIFQNPAEYEKVNLVIQAGKEIFFFDERILKKPGYLELYPKKEENAPADLSLYNVGDTVSLTPYGILEGKTSPPSRYNSGSIILAMENAGNLIEDEELRAQIKGCGIGTSATRADIIAKLVKDNYIKLETKTQILKPEALGEYIYLVLKESLPVMKNPINPELTASWELGLSQVTEGKVSYDQYLDILENYICETIQMIKEQDHSAALLQSFQRVPGGKEATVCPVCGNRIRFNKAGAFCASENCLKIFSNVGTKENPINLSEKQIRSLLAGRKIKNVRMISKAGNAYKANLYLDMQEKAIRREFAEEKKF